MSQIKLALAFIDDVVDDIVGDVDVIVIVINIDTVCLQVETM